MKPIWGLSRYRLRHSDVKVRAAISVRLFGRRLNGDRGNHLLAALSTTERERLYPCLQLVQMPATLLYPPV